MKRKPKFAVGQVVGFANYPDHHPHYGRVEEVDYPRDSVNATVKVRLYDVENGDFYIESFKPLELRSLTAREIGPR